MKWKGDNAIRSDAIRIINENGSLNPGGQVTGLNEAARQHHGKFGVSFARRNRWDLFSYNTDLHGAVGYKLIILIH